MKTKQIVQIFTKQWHDTQNGPASFTLENCRKAYEHAAYFVLCEDISDSIVATSSKDKKKIESYLEGAGATLEYFMQTDLYRELMNA